jgi:hypothetical protein
MKIQANDDEAKRLSDLLCPVHASLDSRHDLTPFDNCIACIRVERDELREKLATIRDRIITDQTTSAADYSEAEEYANRMVGEL